MYHGGFAGDIVVKNLAASTGDARDVGLTPGLGRFHGVGYGNPLQNFYLGSHMNRGIQWATVHGASTSQT